MECDCCRQHAMRHEIGTLLLSFSVCTHDNAGYIICHDISGVDNDDFVATVVKMVTCISKCYGQCLGVLNAWALIMMLENGGRPRRNACLKLRDYPSKKYFTQIIVSPLYIYQTRFCNLMTTAACHDILKKC